MTITIRVAGPADAEAVQAIYAPVVTGTAISFEQTPLVTGNLAHKALQHTGMKVKHEDLHR